MEAARGSPNGGSSDRPHSRQSVSTLVWPRRRIRRRVRRWASLPGEASGRSSRSISTPPKLRRPPSGGDGLMVIENYGANIETWRAVFRIRRRAHLFRYPRGVRHADRQTAIGVDLRGQGGF